LAEAAYQSTVAQFWRTIGVDQHGAQVVRTAATIPPPGGVAATPAPVEAHDTTRAGASLREQLEGLARLHADGVLSDEEFAAAKRRILEI
jgi:hypothetical protein